MIHLFCKCTASIGYEYIYIGRWNKYDLVDQIKISALFFQRNIINHISNLYQGTSIKSGGEQGSKIGLKSLFKFRGPPCPLEGRCVKKSGKSKTGPVNLRHIKFRLTFVSIRNVRALQNCNGTRNKINHQRCRVAKQVKI